MVHVTWINNNTIQNTQKHCVYNVITSPNLVASAAASGEGVDETELTVVELPFSSVCQHKLLRPILLKRSK